jgi:acyl-CoA synthetase (AMP-forming)/AMP-acid ligase II
MIRQHQFEKVDLVQIVRPEDSEAAHEALTEVPTGADGIVVFVSSANADLDHIRETSKEHLPSYMHPSRVLNVGTFPLNANGKIDRKALLAQLASEPPGTTP